MGGVIGPGAYAFVPARTLHGIEKAGSEGCLLFFLYPGLGGPGN
jgi:hypothetical protein